MPLVWQFFLNKSCLTKNVSLIVLLNFAEEILTVLDEKRLEPGEYLYFQRSEKCVENHLVTNSQKIVEPVRETSRGRPLLPRVTALGGFWYKP